MRSGFFNSDITGYNDSGMPIFDRAEDAEFFAHFFKSFFTNGVYPNPSSNLQVSIQEGMNVKVLPGLCLIEGYFGWEDTERVLAIQASESLDRIDRIVLRLNLADRTIDLYVKKGVGATNPVAPEITRPLPNQGGDIFELGIADIFVAKNTTSITQQRITDLRLNNEFCGLVVQTVKGIDTTTLFQQLQGQISENMELIQSALDETLAGDIISKLTKDLNKLVIPTTAIWTQLTSSTANEEELENDPNLTYPWFSDVLFNCTENDYVELQPNIPTSELGVAPFNYSKTSKLRIYASDNLIGKELKFMVCRKTRKNEVV
ncbi:hypothetical protein [Anaerorhabdus furcosa]|uniref:Uncharacterized protein n=1 Tax=Anaerorhabdus furcosa TaxID=118967 RepID=A0A1T4LSE0_9FIRM|nr:hypothetical protein [Anaerorhabdus furcosa]SJZ57374.1 hypothetical protein SAMN02745191_1011 [Anaerorhabdus furcosa]